MKKPQQGRNEEKRLEALRAYDILDSDTEKEFDDLAELAASICNTPASMINLLDHSRQWAKARFGEKTPVQEIPREQTVCHHTILKDTIFEVRDLTKDNRFANLPYVREHPKVRFYAGTPLLNPDGYAIGALCVLDYKESKLNDTQKKQLKILADEVMARLELRKQNKTLKQRNEQAVQLMKMLSHDMRSPLNGIIGMTNLLASLIDDKREEQEILEIIEQSAFQLNHLIDEILNYSIMESSGFSLNRKQTDLNNVLEKMEKLYQPAARSKNIQLIFLSRNIDTPIYIDTEKFEQIMGNLVSNAIKFTEKEGTVECKLVIQEEQLILTVTDSGVGMGPEKQNKLFVKEVWQGQAGTHGEKSTGLGLKIVKNFVDLHKGSIDVKSSPENGTEFIVTIPLRLPEEE